MLRAQPLLGRSFTPEEEVRGGPDAVILGEAEWRNRFGAAPDVIGRTLMVNSVAREIVGVMPESFAFPMLPERTRLWLPAKRAGDATVGEFAYAGVAHLCGNMFALFVFGRVVEGTEVVDAIEMVRTGRKGFHDDVPLDDVLIVRVTEAA